MCTDPTQYTYPFNGQVESSHERWRAMQACCYKRAIMGGRAVNDQIGSGRYLRGTASGYDVERSSYVVYGSRFQNGNDVQTGDQTRSISRNG